MFSNRFYFIKIAIVSFTLTWLSYRSENHFAEKYPHFYNYMFLPEENDGKQVGTDTDRVVSVNPSENAFEIEEKGFTIKVKGADEMPKVGDFVNLQGRFNKSGFLEPLPQTMVIHKNYKIKRGIMYAISIVVIGVWFFYFVKVFRPTLHKGVFISRGG